MDKLLAMQTMMAGGGQPTTKDSPAAATEAVPEGGAEPASDAPGEDGAGGSADAGQTDLSQDLAVGHQEEETAEERTAREEAEAAAAGGAPEGALPAELADLPEDVRNELLALAAEVAEGKTSFGELKRGHKLIGKHAEEVQRLNEELDGYKAKLAEATAGNTSGPTLFKSVADVEARELKLQKVIDWCEDNADGGQNGDVEFTAAEVKQMRREARDELKYTLPAQKQKLQAAAQQQTQFTAQQTAARPQVLEQFPQLKDPQNPETRQVNEMLRKQPMLKAMFVSPELAALTWIRGEAAVRAELAKRSPNGKVQSPKANGQSPKAGAIPKGRPSGPGGSAAPARTNGVTVAKAKEQIAKERSVGGLANLMAAMEPQSK